MEKIEMLKDFYKARNNKIKNDFLANFGKIKTVDAKVLYTEMLRTDKIKLIERKHNTELTSNDLIAIYFSKSLVDLVAYWEKKCLH